MKTSWLRRIVPRVTVVVVILAVMTIAGTVGGLHSLPVLAKDSPIEDKLGEEQIIISPKVLVDGIEVASDESGNYSLKGGGVLSTEDGYINGSITLNGNWIVETPLLLMGQITVLSGSFVAGNVLIDCGSFYVGLYTDDTEQDIYLGNSTINTFTFALRGDNVNFDAGTSTINTTLLFDDTAKDGHQYNIVNISPKGGVYGFIEGQSTFTKLNINGTTPCYVADSIGTDAPVTSSAELTAIPVLRNVGKTIQVMSKKALNISKLGPGKLDLGGSK